MFLLGTERLYLVVSIRTQSTRLATLLKMNSRKFGKERLIKTSDKKYSKTETELTSARIVQKVPKYGFESFLHLGIENY